MKEEKKKDKLEVVNHVGIIRGSRIQEASNVNMSYMFYNYSEVSRKLRS